MCQPFIALNSSLQSNQHDGGREILFPVYNLLHTCIQKHCSKGGQKYHQKFSAKTDIDMANLLNTENFSVPQGLFASL